MRIGVYTVLCLLIAVTVSGCLQTREVEEKKDEVKIGALLPLSGDDSPFAAQMIDSIELAIKEVNENGGVLGSELKLVVEDTNTSEVQAMKSANNLVKRERIPVVIGTLSSATAMATVSITADNEVVQISPANTCKYLTTYPEHDFYFRTVPSDVFQGMAMSRLAFEEGYMTAATLVVNNPYGIGLEEVFRDKFETGGGSVIKSVRYDPEGTIFDREVDRIVSGNPDLVVLAAQPQTGTIILRTAYEKGYLKDIDWLLSEGCCFEEFAEIAGRDDSGRYIVAGIKGTTLYPKGPGYETFEQKYTEEYGIGPGTYCSNSYDAAAVVALAVERAGEAKGRAIRDNLRDVANPPGVIVTDIAEGLRLIRQGQEINYQGASGEITFDENGDVFGKYCVWSFAEDGSIQLGREIDTE